MKPMPSISGKFTLRGCLEVALALGIALSLICYFLLPSGNANNFPTYLVGVLVLMVGASWLNTLRRSWVLIGSFALAAYLTLSLTWSVPEFDEEVHSLIGNALLSILFVAGITVSLSRFGPFQSLVDPERCARGKPISDFLPFRWDLSGRCH